MSFQIFEDESFSNNEANKSTILPYINNLTAPPVRVGVGGGIAYNPTTQTLYYSNGTTWVAVATSTTSTATDAFGLSSTGGQVIPNSVNTLLTNITGSVAPYHNFSVGPFWAFTSYTCAAPIAETMEITASVEWFGDGITSNVGIRTLQILVNGSVVKTHLTQPNSDSSQNTSQECSINVRLVGGDVITVQVFQNSGAAQTILAGTGTTISGIRVSSV